MVDLSVIRRSDPEIYEAMRGELERQRGNLELIASENIVSPAVLAAAGTFMTNKYAEGYPGKRYYAGCRYVDLAESLAIERAKLLFGAEHANVQPHCGANANTAVYFAVLNPGDTIMGMNLAHGGHLTHGAKVNISGKYFNIAPYGVDKDTGLIDYDEVRRIAVQSRPKIIVAGASAYPRIIDFEKFRRIADEVGAYLMVDMAHIAGLVATGLHPSPVPYADFVTSTTHKTLRGPRGGLILCKEKYAAAVDKAVFPGTQGGPLMHIIAAKAIAFKEALAPEFAEYQRRVLINAKQMEKRLRFHGIKMVADGTDNHLVLLNLIGTGITGKQLDEMLEKVHITANKNAVPFDPEKPAVTSGLRIGSAVLTTRGMGEKEMDDVIDCIADIIQNGEKAFDRVREKADELCARFPLYTDCIQM